MDKQTESKLLIETLTKYIVIDARSLAGKKPNTIGFNAALDNLKNHVERLNEIESAWMKEVA